MEIPITWKFRRTGELIPILEAVGESESEMFEWFLIDNAITIIQVASDFGGRPLDSMPKDKRTAKITVSVSLIFKQDKDISEFVKYLEEDLPF